MNLQRREEISALLAAPVTGGAGQVLEYRDALMECRAHIDALEQAAAERVIDSGRLEAAEALAERLGGMVERMKQGIKPSTAERCAARWAMSSAVDRGSFERGWDAREAEGSRSPTPDYTGEGSAWVPPAEAQAVVVPDVVRGVTHTGISWEVSRPGDYYWERGAWREWKADGQMANASSFAWIRPFPVRPIPADRELMRLVDELIRWHGLRPLDKRPDHAAALVGAIKALRAQPTQELAP